MHFKRFPKPLSQIFGNAARPPPPAADQAAALDSAAVMNLEDGETLRGLAGLGGGGGGGGAPLERFAQERVAQLIDAGRLDFRALCAPGVDLSALLAVASRSSDPGHLSRAFGLIDDPRRIAELVTQGSSSRIRQIAAQSISDPVELRRLLRELRGKDKGVYKIIRQKCDALHAEELRPVQIQHDVIAACESLERHSHRVYDVIYEPSFRHFHSRWQALEPQAPPAIRQRAARAIERCQEIMAEHLEGLARQAALESEQAARQAARLEAAALAELMSQRRSEAESLAKAEAAARREAEAKLRADQSAAEALAVRQIGGLIGRAHEALREGSTGRASGLRRAVEEKLSALPAVPAPLAKQLLKLDQKLEELKEWKEHAAAPKRAELIREMESLVGSPQEPRALADRIKQLQEDWKTVSKGIVIDTEADWQRFHQASLEAYRPCRDYFEAQAKQRAANAGKRRGVLDRLSAFEAAQTGDHPDWRTMAAVLREAPQEWRRYSPVDRAVGRTLQEEFDAALARIQGRIDAWHLKNAGEKAALIQQAKLLAAQEDSRDGVEAVKRLQLRWKEVGPARHDQEQALWTEFRTQCDAIFDKRQQARAQYAAEREADRARAPALAAEERAREQTLRREKEQSMADLFEAARRIQAYGRAVSQGDVSADCDALKQAAETFIAGVRRWPKGGAEATKEALAKAGSAAPADAAAHETALRILCIRSDILTDRPTPPEDQTLRRSYQMECLVRRMGQGADTRPDQWDALALEWIRVGPVPAQIYDSLLARFRS
jgi:hypothetical protein